MNESTRRRVCRTGFLLIALTPCCGVLAVAAWRTSTWHELSLQRSIRDTCGVDASWETLRYTGPGQTCITALTLHDARTGALLGEIEQLTWSELNDRLELTPTTIRVPATALGRIAKLFDQFEDDAQRDWKFNACQLRIVDANGDFVTAVAIEKIDAWRDENVQKLNAYFRPREGSAKKSLRLTVERALQGDGLSVRLDATECPLPASMAQAVWPKLTSLGPQAHFQGNAEWNRDAESWSGSLKDSYIRAIDLESFVTAQTKQQLRGVGELHLDSAEIQQGKLVAAKGRFGANDGEIGNWFVRDLSSYFGFAMPRQFEASAPAAGVTPFSEIRLEFDLRGEALEVAGVAEGALVRDEAGEKLLDGKQSRAAQAHTAVRVLYPMKAVSVPVSHESWWLASRLSMAGAAETPEYHAKPSARPAAPPAKAE